MRSSGIQIISKARDLILSTNKPFHSASIINRQLGLYIAKDPLSIASALSVAENSKSRFLGEQIHAKIVRLCLVDEVFSLNNLIKMYAKCGALDDAIQVFDEMTERNLVSWTLMISGSVQNGEHGLGLEYFSGMARSGFTPNSFGIGSVLKACVTVGAYRFGASVHGFAFKLGIDRDSYVGGSVVNMYFDSEDVRSAKNVFESLSDSDIGCWNAMIGGLAKCGHGLEAVEIFRSMLRRGMSADQFTFVNSLKGCSETGDPDFGKIVHGLIVKNGAESSTSVMNCVTDLYFRLGEKFFALKVFNGIRRKDVISWNTVFSHVFEDKNGKQIITSLFRDFMLGEIIPNRITFSVLLRECGNVCDLALGSQFHSLAIKFGLHDEVTVSNSIIHLLSRCNDMEKAQKLFDVAVVKDIVTWNQMISGHCLNDCHIEALRLFVKLCGSGVGPNKYTFTSVLEACYEIRNELFFRLAHGALTKHGFSSSGHLCSLLINGYVKFGLLSDSFQFFTGIDRLDYVSRATMISALVREGHVSEGLAYLNKLMKTGENPDEFVLGSVLSYCADNSYYRLTKIFHSLVSKTGLETQVFVASGLIDAYAKSGDIEAAKKVYDETCFLNDVVIYNTMITGYARHGLIREAAETVNAMTRHGDLFPSRATFVSVVSACSHAGLVDEGFALFESVRGSEVPRDVFGCVVDMLSRNGRLEEARRVIEEMPRAPWPAMLRSFLNGCRIHGKRELGEWSARKLVRLAPEDDEDD